MALLYRSANVAITNAAAGTTLTHSLSRTAANLVVIVTPKGNNSNSLGVGVSTIGVNSVVLVANAAGVTADVAILEFHSIQGGPAAV